MPPPPPGATPQIKVTIVGENKTYGWENLIGPFLVHKLLGPRTPPPHQPLLIQATSGPYIFGSGHFGYIAQGSMDLPHEKSKKDFKKIWGIHDGQESKAEEGSTRANTGTSAKRIAQV